MPLMELEGRVDFSEWTFGGLADQQRTRESVAMAFQASLPDWPVYVGFNVEGDVPAIEFEWESFGELSAKVSVADAVDDFLRCTDLGIAGSEDDIPAIRRLAQALRDGAEAIEAAVAAHEAKMAA